MILKIGQLYKCDRYFLYMFKTIDGAVDMVRRSASTYPEPVKPGIIDPENLLLHGRTVEATVQCVVKYHMDCTRHQCTWAHVDDVFMIIDQRKINNQVYCKILCGKKVGWIVWQDWMNIHEANET